MVVGNRSSGLGDDGLYRGARGGIEVEHSNTAGTHRRTPLEQAREFEAVLDQGYDPVQSGNY